MEPPYLRIAAEIRARIDAGELRPGDAVPSTRAVMREWGVALATAAKALGRLRQDGVVEAHPGAGTVVKAPARRRAPTLASTLTRERIAAAAVHIADAEGLDELSMRRLADELGVGVMSLYRHVTGRDELLHLMMRRAFRSRPLPDPAPAGWRERLDAVCRAQWALYRDHPWTIELVSVTRPMLLPEGMAQTESTLAALHDLGLDPTERAREAVTLPALVRGMALAHRAESVARCATGLDADQWWHTQAAEVQAELAGGRYPHLTALTADVVSDVDLLFERWLRQHLDGLAARVS